MLAEQSNSPSNRFTIPPWVLDRVLSANLRLNLYMVNALAINAGLTPLFDAQHEDLIRLRDDRQMSSLVFGSPFLAFLPTLTSPEDWKSFIDGRTPTTALAALNKQLPKLSFVDAVLLEQGNRAYIGAMYDVLNMSILAAPLLGISQELADYLRSVPQHVIDLAIAERRVPLFKWRIPNRMFWFEAGVGQLTPNMIAHYLMDVSPIRSDRLPHSGIWGNFRLTRHLVDAYCEAFIRLRCRAKSVAALFNVSANKMRELYLQIHGESSPSGQQPASSIWYLDSASRRVQATFQIWLFRSAVAANVTVPQAFVAAMDISNRMFPDSSVPAERAFHLARSMATDSDLAIRPCRSCGTPYLASNTAPRIELAHSFQCPSCTGTLSSPNSPQRRRQRGRPPKSDARYKVRSNIGTEPNEAA